MYTEYDPFGRDDDEAWRHTAIGETGAGRSINRAVQNQLLQASQDSTLLPGQAVTEPSVDPPSAQTLMDFVSSDPNDLAKRTKELTLMITDKGTATVLLFITHLIENRVELVAEVTVSAEKVPLTCTTATGFVAKS